METKIPPTPTTSILSLSSPMFGVPETRRVHTNLTSSAPRFCVYERGNSLFFVVEKESELRRQKAEDGKQRGE